MLALLLACADADPLDSADGADTKDASATLLGDACAAISGTANPGAYATCEASKSSGYLVVHAEAIGGCATCSAALTFFTFPKGEQNCASGEIGFLVNDDPDDTTYVSDWYGYAGISSEGPLGDCVVTTDHHADDEDGTVAWSGTIEGTLRLIGGDGGLGGVMAVEFSAQVDDAS